MTPKAGGSFKGLKELVSWFPSYWQMTTRPKLVWDSGWSFANNSGTRTPIFSVPYSVLHFTLELHNVQNL